MEKSSIINNRVLSNASSSKSASASKSHSEAERRRRERINAHLATLRTLLPNTIKTDKASLLAEVVQHVKDLKNRAQDGNRTTDQHWAVPDETDELTLGYWEEEEEGPHGWDPEAESDHHHHHQGSSLVVRVSMSCEDRAGLLTDVTRAVRSVRGRVVRAEMGTVGGRTRSALVVEFVGRKRGGDHDHHDHELLLGVLRKALKGVLDRPPPHHHHQVLLGNKRPRFVSHPLSYYSTHPSSSSSSSSSIGLNAGCLHLI
ncbi:hypothetical protein Syun_015429 [Stephania yunnanensis]|uniref:BHLH domain-containing protein n=1 Tax=Stephania yunnanensis TaxID=152371 RepID=A0AAP0JLN7_9MAGN